jgi:sialate O-acetylesterase
VATTDLGMEKCIHPTQKREVALRLAALALKESYGRKLPNEMCYPMQIQEVRYEQGEALVTLRNARWGLTPEGEEVLGFELAGEDGIFYPARAEIIKSKPQIKVVSPQVAEPVALRYAFRNYTPTNLHNTLGQPLLPYRSDR